MDVDGLSGPSGRDFSTGSILRCARVDAHSSYLIRNPQLLKSLESILSASPEPVPVPSKNKHCNLSSIISKNRQKLGLESKVPLRPFLPPTRFNGAFSNEITQFILDEHT